MSNTLKNVEKVRHQVADAARRAGRDPSTVTVIAVSKTRTIAEIEQVLAAGLNHLGESRVQELQDKWPAFGGRAAWHLIGSLQTNKVKPAVQMAGLIHSLDRESLAQALSREAERREAPVNVLVQVNVSGEESKHGIAPAALEPFLHRIGSLGGLQVQGLMTMAPHANEPELARPHFRRLRELARELGTLGLPHVNLHHLSMGMSGDFEVAVEEGATLVRVGTAIFGAREHR